MAMKNRSSPRSGAKNGTAAPLGVHKSVPRHLFPLFLRIATHLGALIPLVVLIWDFQTNHLTENPIQAAEQRTGTIALVLLLLSLACTPLNTLFRFSQAIQRRRALGLYAFFYASLHLFIFTVVDYGLDWPTLLQMLVEKRYIIGGLATFAILV